MLILHDENLTINGVQIFPEISNEPHIVADDSLFDQVAAVSGYAKLIDNNGTLELPIDLEGLAAEKQLQELTASMRSERDAKLLALDSIVSNPLRYNASTSEQKVALEEYRQALLDVPQQTGFPQDVEWPVMPEI